MRALAERAGVSVVTPYNLFGSKQAIMNALLDEDIGQYGAQLSRSRQDPLEIFFRAVTLGKIYFQRDQHYYRAVLFAVYADGGAEYRKTFGGPRRALWRSLVENAVASGYLRQDVDVDALSRNLAGIYFAHILEWITGEMSLEELETRTHYGFAMSLYSMAAPAHAERMRERIQRAQLRLPSVRRRRAAKQKA